MMNPCAVFWLIVSIIINSFDCIIWKWPMPHIRKKCFKGIQPFVAHFYSTPTVSFKIFSIFIITSLFNVAPSIPFGRFCHTMNRFSSFVSKTTTRFSMTRGYVIQILNNFFAAIAQAKNHWFVVFASFIKTSSLDDCKSSKSCVFIECFHGLDYNIMRLT